MEGLAKTATVAQPTEQIATTTPTATRSQMSWEGVPVEVFRYFGVDVGKADRKDIEQLRDIYQIASEESEGDLTKSLEKINSWELKVGAPRITETSYSKIWNYVKMQNHINKLLKQQEILIRRPA